jgi:hypothetical protein
MPPGHVPVVMPGRMRLRRFVEGQTWTLTDVPTAEIVHISVLLMGIGPEVMWPAGQVRCLRQAGWQDGWVSGWLGQRVAGPAGGWVSEGEWSGARHRGR